MKAGLLLSFVMVYDDFIISKSPDSMLPAFVINLDRDRERWKSVLASAHEHAPQIELHRIDAVDGNAAGHASHEIADVPAFERACGRLLLPGEYGCYLSHLNALRAFIEHGAPYGLIMEDDVLFAPNTSARIAAIIEALPQFGVIKLVNHRVKMMIELTATDGADCIGRTLHGPQGSAAAYLVSREGAEQLVDRLARMKLPWDIALEQDWVHGAPVFSTRADVLAFSGHRAKSNIADRRAYGDAKFPWYRRIDTGLVRAISYARRIGHVWNQPSQAQALALRARDASHPIPLWGEILAACMMLLFVSAVWVESDAYRYAGLALFLAACTHYFRSGIWHYADRPRIGWPGMMCIFWSIYIAGRFAYSQIAYPELGSGSSEGIFMLPALYPATGLALLLYLRRPFVLAVLFIAISAAALVFGNDYNLGIHARAVTHLHNNPIHASIGAGFICLTSICFLLYLAKQSLLQTRATLSLAVLGCTTLALSLLAIVSLWSKGVWLAIAIAIPVLAVTSLATEKNRTLRLSILAVLVVFAAGVVANFGTLSGVARPAISASTELLQDLFQNGSLTESLSNTITNITTGDSERERMMLWANALHIWKNHPISGAGIAWLHEWQQRPYQETTFNLLHNGYLETAVRYGLLGLTFYFVLFVWTVRSVWRAAREGFVDRTLFQWLVASLAFFAATLLSNSNNRLAIGESYMWLAAAIGFYCAYLRQRNGRPAN